MSLRPFTKRASTGILLDSGHTKVIIGVTCMLVALSVCVLCLRFLVRYRISKKFYADDWWMLLATVSVCAWLYLFG